MPPERHGVCHTRRAGTTVRGGHRHAVQGCQTRGAGTQQGGDTLTRYKAERHRLHAPLTASDPDKAREQRAGSRGGPLLNAHRKAPHIAVLDF